MNINVRFLHQERASSRCDSAIFHLNQLDPVAVGVLDEGDDAIAPFHRSGFSGDCDAFFFKLLASGINIGHIDAQVAQMPRQVHTAPSDPSCGSAR